MQTYDLVIIGGGEAGQAAAHLARHRGASVAVVERELFGGSCPYWACMPSKALLHAAAAHAAGGHYPWQHASDFRDWMIVRERPLDWPDDSSHVKSLEKAGATVTRGTGLIDGPGRVRVRSDGRNSETFAAKAILIAVGSNATIPDDIEGLDQIRPWTNREATTTRELPMSLVVLGAGPTGVEMSQVYARYGVPTVLVSPHDRINPKDHPRSSAVLEAALRRDGVDIRTGVRATHVRPGAGHDGHAVELTDGATVTGHEILLAVGRTYPLAGLGLETVGVNVDDGVLQPDENLRIADGVYVAGDPAGPEMHTHLAVYQGELAARIALGEDVRPDHTAIPHAIYTEPQAAGVGLQLDEARERGLDAFEETTDYATSAPGYIAEAAGHVTIVVDRRDRVLLGAFIAAPGAADAIGEAVLAVRTRTPLEVLADTIHPFPTTVRVMGGLFAKAARRE